LLNFIIIKFSTSKVLKTYPRKKNITQLIAKTATDDGQWPLRVAKFVEFCYKIKQILNTFVTFSRHFPTCPGVKKNPAALAGRRIISYCLRILLFSYNSKLCNSCLLYSISFKYSNISCPCNYIICCSKLCLANLDRACLSASALDLDRLNFLSFCRSNYKIAVLINTDMVILCLNRLGLALILVISNLDTIYSSSKTCSIC